MTVFDWWEGAACRGKGIRYFFPETPDDLAQGRAICETCPVRANCLDYAGQSPSPQGVWGGLTERERRAIRPRAA
jgi:WhiB family transcriptional regulator, redox-sensing transcriptional regulator